MGHAHRPAKPQWPHRPGHTYPAWMNTFGHLSPDLVFSNNVFTIFGDFGTPRPGPGAIKHQPEPPPSNATTKTEYRLAGHWAVHFRTWSASDGPGPGTRAALFWYGRYAFDLATRSRWWFLKRSSLQVPGLIGRPKVRGKSKIAEIYTALTPWWRSGGGAAGGRRPGGGGCRARS